MKVWLVQYDHPYEGGYTFGVFSTLQKAEEYFDTLSEFARDWVTIEEWNVDSEISTSSESSSFVQPGDRPA